MNTPYFMGIPDDTPTGVYLHITPEREGSGTPIKPAVSFGEIRQDATALYRSTTSAAKTVLHAVAYEGRTISHTSVFEPGGMLYDHLNPNSQQLMDDHQKERIENLLVGVLGSLTVGILVKHFTAPEVFPNATDVYSFNTTITNLVANTADSLSGTIMSMWDAVLSIKKNR